MHNFLNKSSEAICPYQGITLMRLGHRHWGHFSSKILPAGRRMLHLENARSVLIMVHGMDQPLNAIKASLPYILITIP
jgi:hypothetical protein